MTAMPDIRNPATTTLSMGAGADTNPRPAPQLAVDLPLLHQSTGATNEDPILDFFRLTPVPTIILDASLAIRQISDSYLAISGDSRRDQVIGYPLHDLLGQRWILPSPSLAHKAIDAAQEIRQPCKQTEIQPDGTAWTIRAVPIYRLDNLEYIQLEVNDTTVEHRKQLEMEEELHTNETFRILVQSMKDYAIFLLDVDGNVATWNDGAQRFKGYTKQEIIGKHFSAFYCKEDCDNDKPGRELAEALRNGRVEDEGWRYRKDASRFWANVIITPIYRNNELLGYSKITRDLSERRKAEADLIAAYEESSKLKSEFLANMSHEIRTPMHGLLSALTLLLDTPLNPEQTELTSVIQESGDVLMQVINDILDYSKLTHGGFAISHDIINVVDIIQSVYRVHEKSCKPDITLQIHLDPRLPSAAEGDSLRFRQIVQNLLSNAMKFTEVGYIYVNTSLQEHREDDDFHSIITEVIDTGVGIPDEASQYLFKPFVQFDNSATKRYKGTGLGLSICKSLSELMNGHIGFHANPDGRGSVFWFTVKLRKVRQSHLMQNLQDCSTATNPSTPLNNIENIKRVATDKTLLLAEDNPINRKIMLKMLKGLGFTHVDLAADGRQAVALSTERSTAPYHIILMDINMPVLDGVSATKEIRSAGLHTPIVAMTANALKGQAESYLAKGMTAYVSKPVDRKLLVDVLLRCLEHADDDVT